MSWLLKFVVNYATMSLIGRQFVLVVCFPKFINKLEPMKTCAKASNVCA